MNRQITIRVAWTVFLVFLGSPSPACSDERPNIVWIIADDFSPDLGCYGSPGVATPHLDRLAEQGLRYTAAFATAPVCSASRSALITGVSQTSTGTQHHREPNPQPLPPPIQPITELLRQAGYFVCNSNSTMEKRGKEDYNFAFSGKMYDGTDWQQRSPGQPFFAQVQIYQPHRPFLSTPDPKRAPQVVLPTYYPDHPVIRADWANYLTSVEELDRLVGEVLERLDRDGLADNTVVFFFGDHGRPHYRDKQWLYDGGIQVPLLVRWPTHLPQGQVRQELISLLDVSAATVRLAGLEVPSWMQGRDLLDPDLPPRQQIFAARDRCGDAVDRIRCVRTAQFKYIRNFYPDRPYTQHSSYKELEYPGMAVCRALQEQGDLTGPAALFWSDQRPAEELYDLQADPEELHNLAASPAHADTLSALRQTLQEWLERTGDRGGVAEPGLQATIQSSRKWHKKTMKQRGFRGPVRPDQYLRWWQKELNVE